MTAQARLRLTRFGLPGCRPLALLSLLALAAIATSVPAQPAPPRAAARPAAESANPWDVLAALRAGLVKAGPITARFEQTYVPAGFSSGDVEKGHFSLWLPDCLRWSYVEPQVKSFLLCKKEAWAWNEEEEGGRHYRVEPEKEPGLDLMLLDLASLKERYSAEGRQLDGGLYEILLTVGKDKKDRNDKKGLTARVRIDRAVQRVVGLEYRDEDGNLSRFAISEYQTLGHTALFQPPQDIQWKVE